MRPNAPSEGPARRLMPVSIEWEDGRKFDIDEITNVCRASSTKAGGAGIRYTVLYAGLYGTYSSRKINGLSKTNKR